MSDSGLRTRHRGAALLLWLCLLAGCTPAARGDDHLVMLLYHHVAEDTPPLTSTTPQRFRAHLDALAEGGYTIVPLADAVAALAGRKALPDRSVVITFDDAYESVLTTAAPELARRGWPFTLFVSTDPVDQGLRGYLDWDGIRELEGLGATIGNHTRSHTHLVRRRPGEDAAAWRQRVRNEVLDAQARLEAELARPLKILAYPYGEFDPEVQALTQQIGFVGLGQQSGPAGYYSDATALPRFPLATGFDGLEALSDKLRSRPFRVEVLAPDTPVLEASATRPVLRLQADPAHYDPDRLRCFVGGQPAPAVRWLDRDAGRFEVQASRPLGAGRSKYTCTAPSRLEAGAFHWFTWLWLKPNPDGSWYAG